MRQGDMGCGAAKGRGGAAKSGPGAGDKGIAHRPKGQAVPQQVLYCDTAQPVTRPDHRTGTNQRHDPAFLAVKPSLMERPELAPSAPEKKLRESLPQACDRDVYTP